MTGSPMSRTTASGGRTAIASRASGSVDRQRDVVAFETKGPVEGAADCRIIVHHEHVHRGRSLPASCRRTYGRRR